MELKPVPAVVVKLMGAEPPGDTLALAALAANVRLGLATARVMT